MDNQHGLFSVHYLEIFQSLQASEGVISEDLQLVLVKVQPS